MNKIISVLLTLMLGISVIFSGAGCTRFLPTGELETWTEDVEISVGDTQKDTTVDVKNTEADSEEDTLQGTERDTKSNAENDTEQNTETDSEGETTKEKETSPSKETTEDETVRPGVKPTEAPTTKPGVKPTEAPTTKPSVKPTVAPTQAPTAKPTVAPTQAPTQTPGTPWQPTTNNTYNELATLSNITDADITNARNILSSIVTNQMTDVQKIKAVHDYLVMNTWYDTSYYSKDDYHDHLENILVEHRAVCQGYSVAFYVFMKELGIPCTVLMGEADNGNGMEDHAWNAVKLDGSWYFIDVTWDDPIVDGSTAYTDGRNMSYEFLLCTFDHIGLTHTFDDYVETLPTPYGTSNSYNDQMYLSKGIDGLYRITSLDVVAQVGAGVNDTCTYMFIIEGGGITIGDVADTFIAQLQGRVAGGISYSYSDTIIEITFSKS